MPTLSFRPLLGTPSWRNMPLSLSFRPLLRILFWRNGAAALVRKLISPKYATKSKPEMTIF